MLLRVNPGLIIYTVLTFLLLLFILKKLAWKPILGALEERERRIQESLEGAEKAKRQAEELLAQQRQMLEAARQEAQEILEQSRKAAEAVRQQILADARAQANQMLEKAQREIALSRDKAIDEIRKLAVDLSIAAAEKVIRRSLGPEEHRRLVEEAIEEMKGLS
ncbi:MAG: F0F1 ATP synthase subunit B [candidate division KSB1 bacterium]|nr:F0F1 ATP synthase subunit B [candidate division KSB1 bacterium]